VGYTFFTQGFKNLFLLHPNMDSWWPSGTTASYVYSIANMINGNHMHLYLKVWDDHHAGHAGQVHCRRNPRKKTGAAIKKLMNWPRRLHG
jgi:hypothetical protein